MSFLKWESRGGTTILLIIHTYIYMGVCIRSKIVVYIFFLSFTFQILNFNQHIYYLYLSE